MIHDLKLELDDAQFPVVSWQEDRNLHGPQALGRAALECRIMQAGADLEGIAPRTLMFVARGSVRHGRFEEGKPWQHLSGFALKGGEVFARPGEKAALEAISGMLKNPLAQTAARHAVQDRSLAIEAQFGPYTDPIYVNCADASKVEVDQLHTLLVRQFVVAKGDYVTARNRGKFLWPADDDRLPTYQPRREHWDDVWAWSLRDELLPWIAPAMTTAAIIGGLAYWATH